MTKTNAVILGVVLALTAMPVFAHTGASPSEKTGAAIETRMMKAKERANQEIIRRIEKLTELNTKVQGMKRVSDATKASIASTVQIEIANLTALNAKIQAAADLETLKTDIKSIATSYRIFMLIIPQGRIIVSADRIHTVAYKQTEFAGKLKTRIDEVAAQGKDVATLNASLSEMNAKIADAHAQADAAVALVASLTPDMGDKTKMESNNAALKEARAKIKAGMESIKAAHKVAQSIRQALRELGAAASSTTPTL